MEKLFCLWDTIAKVICLQCVGVRQRVFFIDLFDFTLHCIGRSHDLARTDSTPKMGFFDAFTGLAWERLCPDVHNVHDLGKGLEKLKCASLTLKSCNVDAVIMKGDW